MNTIISNLTLKNIPIHQWIWGSLLMRWIGLLQPWQSSSFILQHAESLGAIFISILLGLAPFVSTSLIGVLLIAIAAYWFLLTLTESQQAIPFTPIHLVALLYWMISVIATGLSPAKTAALSGLGKLTLYLLFFVLVARILRNPKIRTWLITFYLQITLVVSTYGIRQAIFGVRELATWTDPTSELAGTQIRVYSYLGNPNLLAAYLIPAVAMSIAAFFVWKGITPKALAITCFIVNTICLIHTYSRGGWIGLVALLITITILIILWFKDSLPPFWQKWLFPIAFTSLSAIALLAIILVPALRIRISSMFAGREDSSNNFRINVWQGVLRMIEAYPLIGIGPGNNVFNKIYPLYQTSPRYTALSAYSIILEVLVEIGIIGLSIFLWLLLVTFDQASLRFQQLNKLADPQGFWIIGAIASLIGLLSHGLFDTVLYRPEVNTLWWFMIALIASCYQIEENSPKQPT